MKGDLAERAAVFEIVHTLTNWYDGPRRGIADYQGQPHLFESEWRDSEDSDDTFLLMAIDQDTLTLALEDWEIWCRWRTAFDQGKATVETHPALPEDRSRHEELKRMLEGRLVIEPGRAIRKKAEFRVRKYPNGNEYASCPFEVRWTD